MVLNELLDRSRMLTQKGLGLVDPLIITSYRLPSGSPATRRSWGFWDYNLVLAAL